MAVEVAITGNGKYAGAKSNISTYSVFEEATPIDASDRSGGVGRISFSAVDDASRLGSVLLLNDTLTLTDGDRGQTEGRINDLDGRDGLLTVSADSRLGRLVIDKQADPVHTTFSDAMLYYLSLGGITTNIAIDTALASIPVVAQGWRGDLWTKIKELCIAHGAEITLLKSAVTVRQVRGRHALEINNVDSSWKITNVDLAKQVEAYYYNSTYKTGSVVYPASGVAKDLRVFTIDSGQTITTNIPVDVSLVSINQPTVQDSVAQTYMATSVYAVVDKEGQPVLASDWTAAGGALSVAIGEDRKSLDVTITAMANTDRSPYRIAGVDGPGDYSSSLRVVGTGLHFTQQSLVLPTGADNASTSRDVGVTVDNIFVNTSADAAEILGDVAAKWSSPQRRISATKAYINKPGEQDPTFDYATFAQFDAYAPGAGITTFGNFDTVWSGQTLAQFDAYWYDLVKNDFEFQVFGNVAGARLQWRRAIYRIVEATITEGSVEYTADADTIFSDFDSNADAGDPGMLFSEFDTSYSGLTFNDFALAPLPFAQPEYDR